MPLTSTVILNGVLSLLLVVVFIIVAIKILLKYWNFKDRKFLLTGLAWFGISEPWWPSSIGFLVALFNDTGLSIEVYLILNNAFLPFFLTLWLIIMSDLIKIGKKTLIITIHILISIILEILMFYYLITNPPMVGVKLSPVDVDFGPIAQVFLIYNLSIFLITGFLFAIKTFKLDEPEPKLRGKFLIIAFILFIIGAVMEMIITFPINRIIILSCAIIFYVGFIMPEWIKKHFLKEN
ncbi:MAG: hypothetical protein ACFFAH_08775 [Promethearchaeota archaeon]